MIIELNEIQTTGLAAILLAIGQWLRGRIYFFERFAIPAPVIGGFGFAALYLIFYSTNIFTIEFTTTLQEFFMVVFFTTVGYGASIATLRSAGPKVILFLAVASLLIVFQAGLAYGLAPLLNIDPALSLMTGSVSMTGGHGISGGIAPLVEEAGISGAETVAFTSATFGLIAGSLLGGPLANNIITRRSLSPSSGRSAKDNPASQSVVSILEPTKNLRGEKIMHAFIMILFAMFIGSFITELLNLLIEQFTEMAAFPVYLGSMLIAVFIRYFSDKAAAQGKREIVPVAEVEVVGKVGLFLFLSMALMTIKLWELAELALPLIILLTAQTILAVLFVRFVTFTLMGRNYDAAVLTAGHCGFGMGATPNGVANMEAVTRKFGDSKQAFLILPIVGGMFIDFSNVFITLIFLNFAL